MQPFAVLYEPPLYDDPAFPIIYHQDEMSSKRRAVYTNWHAGVELLYCYEGKGLLQQSPDSSPFEEGDIVVISSNTLHTLHLRDETCRYQCMIVDLPFLLGHGLNVENLYFDPVVRDPEAVACFRAIIDDFEAQPAYYKPQILAHVLTLFVGLMRNHLQPDQPPQTNLRSRRVIIQALEYIRAHLCEPIVIDDISRHIGISKYYFCKLFHTYTGMPVLQYINMLKCDYARRYLLQNNMTISEVAHMLSFQNLSYFSKLYKKYFNVLPSEERRQWQACAK